MRLAGHETALAPAYPVVMSAGLRDRAATLLATGVTQPPAPRPAWLRLRRLDLVSVADVVIALICLGVSDGNLGTLNMQHHTGHGAGQLLLISFAVSAPLVLRSRLPLTAWCASALAMMWASRVVAPPLTTASYIPAGVLVYALCLYAVALRCQPWVVIGAGAATVVGGAIIDWPTTMAAIVIALVPVSAGVIVRSRRSGWEQLAVAERRHEGERALFEERQRIARELHDVVAHHMSVIAIQAEAAPYKSADPPAELVESFAEIRASALTGLTELRRVLGVLRSDPADTVPQPGLDDLPGLLDSARAGGVTVTAEVTGTPRPLPEGADLSAYRIVQEALSNAMRHAPGSAVTVRRHYGDVVLVLEIRNDRCPPGAAATWQRGLPSRRGGGHGIIGMRERAAMLGGHLSAGPTGKGEFLVTAALPLDHDQPAGPP
jgi:signal transduction histidine kinase